ncbi:thioredoxin family protein [Actinokineospora pegani]|uniref:thioredoxin family protein n=1 Tax=Actinokineospora pegani TaxID=2654637 RepID=UPI0012EA80BA|nr:thioredoxin family protein [Actinokineospora pegani]
MTGALVVVATLLVATAIGFALRAANGRVRTAGPDAGGSVPDEVRAVLDPAAAVTLVQLTSAYCAQCGQAEKVLAGAAAATGGLAHTTVDLTDRPELAARLAVLRTPTTLAVDARGVELLRIGGVPKQAELLDALRDHLPA